MNSRALTLSLVMAILAVFFVESYVSSIEEKTQKKFGTEVLVVIAGRDIQEMDTIDETMVELKKIPKTFLEPSAIRFEDAEKSKAITDMKEILVGAVALVPIKKGEQVARNKLTEPSLRTGLAPQITPGKRAFAISVSETTAVGKLVKPGDRVDIIAVMSAGEDNNSNKVAKTILQDKVVLAVGRNVTNNVARLIENGGDAKNPKPVVRSLTQFDGFSSVTLEVEPTEVQLLALLSAGNTKMTLSLRNNDDQDRSNLGSLSFHYLVESDPAFGIRRPAQVPAVQRR